MTGSLKSCGNGNPCMDANVNGVNFMTPELVAPYSMTTSVTVKWTPSNPSHPYPLPYFGGRMRPPSLILLVRWGRGRPISADLDTTFIWHMINTLKFMITFIWHMILPWKERISAICKIHIQHNIHALHTWWHEWRSGTCKFTFPPWHTFGI